VLRVRESSVAEDLVQETLLAAWKSTAEQRDQRVRSEPAWLLGILRHKIADYYRKQARGETAYDPDALAELEASQFSSGGWCGPHWLGSTGPGAWSQTSASLRRREFWEILQACTRHLPEKVARAFLLRELDDCGTEDICSTMGVSQNHLFVMLHRARLALRRCLELNWFGRKKRRVNSV
jgi:RNA polymerase sigma-70 factor (ECF subfamily)